MHITSKEALQWSPPVDGVQYRISSPHSPLQGDAQLIYVLSADTLELVQGVLAPQGIKPEDLIACINEFYPNGRGLNEEKGEHMRMGVGTEVLDFLERESIDHGAIAMFAFSYKRSMQSFLIKHGFQSFGHQNCLHVKKIGNSVAAS